MPEKRYIVEERDGRWWVTHEDQPRVPFPTRDLALRAAIDAAHLIGSRGEDAQVLVRGVDDLLRIQWMYGHDVYPPG